LTTIPLFCCAPLEPCTFAALIIIFSIERGYWGRAPVKVYRQVPRKPRLVSGDESAQFINNQIK
jgi:hypothetical protein